MSNSYYTIDKPAVAELKERGSSFLAHAYPITSVEAFKGHLKNIKEQHPKAAHHCYAYRLGIDGNSFRANDDGEPSGTAGKPILGQIDSRQLTDTAVIVVRYFGGTLLGVPGLIAAYKTATMLALQLTPVLEKPVLAFVNLEYDYTLLNDIMLLVKRFGCVIIETEQQLFCRTKIGIPKTEAAHCLDQLRHMHGVQLTLL